MLLAIGIGTFMTALDTSVVNTILPVISAEFSGKASASSQVAQVEWVVTIYLLVLSGLLLSFGRLGDLRGHKMVYLSGFIVFVFASMLCGLAQSALWLIVFRAIQALGAAMLAANSPAILTKNFPAEQRGRALGLQATMTYLGLTFGPSFGGWLAEQLSWRAVFYINVPVGALAIWLSLRSIPMDTVHKPDERFDIPGALLFMLGLSALLLGLNQGHALGWNSPWIIGLLVGAVMLLGNFLFVEWRKAHPMLDLRLFKDLSFALPALSAVLNYISVYSLIFLMPFYLIQGRGFTPAQAGLILTAQPVMMALIAPLSGVLSDRIGPRIPGALGMTVMALGLFLMSRLGPDTPRVEVLLALGVVGLGTGTFISPNNSALMGAAPRNRQGIAAGILATARNLGMVLGVGLAGAIFTTILAHGQGGGAEQAALSLFQAVRVSFLVACGISLVAAITSGANGRHRQS
ncbi:MAG: MFS transporter [Anaerolineales bacterium]|nr:MFS transporter [Anaerolineales bacterium]